jgi:hypothetical protein
MRIISKKEYIRIKTIEEQNKLQSTTLIKCFEEIESLNKELNVYNQVKKIVEAITEKEIQWFDYSKLTDEQQRFYYQSAQEALKNDAIKNEMNKIINELAEWSITKSDNFEGITAMRFTISGMKLLMERLSDIHNPSVTEEEVEEPNKAI